MKFTSYTRDSGTGESGLDNAMFRQYSSGQGRFMSADLLGGHMTAPQTLNKFAYAHGDPINATDSLGLDTCMNNEVRWSFDGGKTWTDWYADGTVTCVGGTSGGSQIGAGGGPGNNGGGGPDAHKNLRAQALRALLTNPDCASLFGGLTNALNALFGTTYYDSTSGMSNPDPGFISNHAWSEVNSYINSNAPAASVWNRGPSGKPMGDTFLAPLFYTILSPGFGSGVITGQMTIVMHELEHVALQSGTPPDNPQDKNSADSKNINEKCDPKDIPTENSGGSADLTGGTTP